MVRLLIPSGLQAVEGGLGFSGREGVGGAGGEVAEEESQEQ
jgi:hypothetical protein